MSLEEKLDANTAALLANTVALDLLRAHVGHLTGALTTQGPTPPKSAPAPQVAATASTPAEQKAVVGTAKPKLVAASQPKAIAAALPASEAGAITYKDVQIELNKLASQAPEGRAKAVAILAELGVSNGTQLEPGQWETARDKFVAAQGDILG
jgi:hypothetical protein